MAFSGIVACLAAAFQDVLIAEPAANPAGYLGLWTGAAILSMFVTGIAMVLYCRRSTRRYRGPMRFWPSSEFFLSVIAGGLVTFVLYHQVHVALWMLPGLWSIFFSLGIFASYRLLPKATFWVGVFYMMAGVLSLVWATGDFGFLPVGHGRAVRRGSVPLRRHSVLDPGRKTDDD